MRKYNWKEYREADNRFEEIVVHPSLKIWFIYLSTFIVALLVKLFFIVDFHNFELVWRLVVSMGTAYFGYNLLSHITTSYKLNVLEVVGQSGVFSRKIVRIPLNRITNYESRASFLESVLGLNNIMLDTPGGTGYELILSRLKRKDSDLIIERMGYLMGQQKIAEAGSNQELRDIRKQAVG